MKKKIFEVTTDYFKPGNEKGWLWLSGKVVEINSKNESIYPFKMLKKNGFCYNVGKGYDSLYLNLY